MITAEEALARADAWVNGDATADRRDVGIYEFDLGYVVWGVEPPRAEVTRPPETIGTAVGVIDRETGELTAWPPLPAPAVAEQYTRRREAEARFPADVLAELRRAGWQPGRDVAPAVTGWIDSVVRALPLEEGESLEPFPAARAALDEFGGLRVAPRHVYPFAFQPTGHFPDLELFLGLGGMIGRRVFPIGVHADGETDPAELTIDEDGRVFVCDTSGCYFAGQTLDEALTRLVRGVGDTLPEVGRDGTFHLPRS
jgi:hypothetical protein